MAGEKATELTNAIKKFYEDIDADPMAHAGAEIMIVNFNTDAGVVQEYAGIERVNRDIKLSPRGQTNTGAGIELALKQLDLRKEMYTSHGVRHVQPWLILMSDGTTYPAAFYPARDAAINKVVDLVERRKLTFIPVAIGADADLKELSRFSPNIPPLSKQPLNYGEFFKWLSQSLSRASQDAPGESPEIDNEFIVEHVDFSELKRQGGREVEEKYEPMFEKWKSKHEGDYKGKI